MNEIDIRELLAHLDCELQEARIDANQDKADVYGKVRAGEANAYANVIRWVKSFRAQQWAWSKSERHTECQQSEVAELNLALSATGFRDGGQLRQRAEPICGCGGTETGTHGQRLCTQHGKSDI